MRVLRIITRLNVGGPARQATLLTHGLKPHGFDSLLVYGRTSRHEGEVSPPEGASYHVPTLARKPSPTRDLLATTVLSDLMRHTKPDIVHTHTAKAGALGRLSALRSGVPHTVHTYHGHVLSGYFSPAVTRAYLEVERWLARRTTALVAITPHVRDELLQMGVGRPEQWHVALGFDFSRYCVPPARIERARIRFGLDPRRPTVGIVGRLVPIKGHDLFLEASRLILEREPECQFVIAGDGPLRGALEESARANSPDRVHFVGWIDDEELPTMYQALDVLALTSRNEGAGAVLMEAGVSGRPVVATDVGGVRTVVQDGLTGTVVPPNSPAAFACAVLDLLGEPRERARMGERARKHVLENFSAEGLIEDTASLYRSLQINHLGSPAF